MAKPPGRGTGGLLREAALGVLGGRGARPSRFLSNAWPVGWKVQPGLHFGYEEQPRVPDRIAMAGNALLRRLEMGPGAFKHVKAERVCLMGVRAVVVRCNQRQKARL